MTLVVLNDDLRFNDDKVNVVAQSTTALPTSTDQTGGVLVLFAVLRKISNSEKYCDLALQ